MSDDLKAALDARVRSYAETGAAAAILDDTALHEAQELWDSIAEVSDDEIKISDIGAIYVIASFHWCRYLERPEGEEPDDLANALNLFAMLGTYDLQLVPERIASIMPPASLPSPAARVAYAHRLYDEFEKTGRLSLLDNAIYHIDHAVAASTDYATRAGRRSSLGRFYLSRFQRTGQRSDLDSAIQYCQQAIIEASQGDRNLGGYLANLSSAWQDCFKTTGDVDDIDRAIRASRAAVGLPGNPKPSLSLSILANALIARFKHLGQYTDLEEAVEYHRVCVTTVDDNDPYRVMYLNNLAGALGERFQNSHRDADIEEAIEIFRNAVAAIDKRHPFRTTLLTNLSSALALKSQTSGDSTNIDRSGEARLASQLGGNGEGDKGPDTTGKTSHMDQELAQITPAAADAARPTAPGQAEVAPVQEAQNEQEAAGAQPSVVLSKTATHGEYPIYTPSTGDTQIPLTDAAVPTISPGVPSMADVLTEEEAGTYLAERTGLEDSHEAQDLAAELGCLPLTLACAAAFITSQHITYARYRELLAATPVPDSITGADHSPCPHTVAAAILLAVQMTTASDRTGLAKPVLDLIALLSPAGVTRDILHLAAQVLTPHNPEDSGTTTASAKAVTAMDNALTHLTNASLLTSGTDGDMITAHPLTTQIIREQSTRHEMATTAASAVTILQTAAATIEPVRQHASAANDLVRQIAALTAYLASNRESQINETAEDLLRLRRWALRCSNELHNDPYHAINLGQQLATDCERILGADHPETLATRNNLAHAYGSAGQFGDAISIYEQNAADITRLYGPDHPGTLPPRYNLANAYESAGQFGRAIPLFEQLLADAERILGSDDPDTLAPRKGLAKAYQSAGRLNDAIQLFQRATTDCERVLGTGHPDTIDARKDLAYAYLSAGQFGRAIPLFEQNLADAERLLGADHLQTIGSRSYLAGAYRSAGQFSRAISLSEQTLADTERILGPDHPDTLTSMGHLAHAYESAGRLAEAIPLFQQSLAGRERVLGPDHPSTLTTRNNLADAYGLAGRTGEAIPLLEQNLADAERILGPDHNQTLSYRANLLGAYAKADRLGEMIRRDNQMGSLLPPIKSKIWAQLTLKWDVELAGSLASTVSNGPIWVCAQNVRICLVLS